MGSNPTHSANYGNRLSEKSESFFVFWCNRRECSVEEALVEMYLAGISMRALGYYKVDVLTGEVYKTGARKGQPKTRKEWRMDGVKHLLDWAIQLNYYRMLQIC